MDSLEEEMSRFEQEVLGASSSRPPPLMPQAPRPLLPPPGNQTSSNAPRSLLAPAAGTSHQTSTGPRPLIPPSQSAAPGFVPRQAMKSGGPSGGPPPPLMGGSGRPGIPPPGPPRMPPPGPPQMMPPGPSGPPRFAPPGPSGMSAPPGPPPRFPPPPPQLQLYTGPPVQALSATPLNPMAIAQAVAGATGSSGVSATMGGTALLPMPPMPPKKGLVGKQKTDPKKLRMGGGKIWEDTSLDDWDPNDFRIFVGDLGNDVNDDTLARSFSRFPSFLKSKVIRDKYSKKTKGYGFVSFKDPKDFMNAMREMNGRYIGNRPVKLRKSTWKDRQLLVVKKKEKEKKRLGFK